MRKEIVFIGQGGQGVVLMGLIFAKVAQLEGKEAACLPSYGPEARGGKCASEVVISDEPIDFPGLTAPDILVAMSQEGYDASISKVSPETKVFFDIDTVKTILAAKASHIPIAATRKATEVGARIAANMVMLGAVVAVTRLVSLENLFDAVKRETSKFAEVNLDALREGYRIGKKHLIQLS